MKTNPAWKYTESGNNGKGLCDDAVAYILDCPLEELKDLTLGDLTRHFQVSKMYLNRCFKTYRKTTPGKFIFREKMLRASDLVLQAELTIKDIADKLGFCSPDYFIQVFKKYFGMPPCQYRSHRTRQNREYQQNTPKKTTNINPNQDYNKLNKNKYKSSNKHNKKDSG